MSSWITMSNGGLSALWKRLSEKVLTDQIWDMSLEPRDMLETHLVGRASNPALSIPAFVSTNISGRFVLVNAWSHSFRRSLWWWIKADGLGSSLGRARHRAFTSSCNENSPVDFTCRHAEIIDFSWHVTSVTREVRLAEKLLFNLIFAFLNAQAHFILFPDRLKPC